jgi:hypothetical protein
MAIAAITHFKFKSLPDPNAVDSLINAVTIVIDTNYDIADQNLLTFERTARFDNLSLSTPFLYTVVDNVNNFESNEALIDLEWKGVALNPASSNVALVINNLDVVNLLDTLPLNDTTEWIDVQTMVGLQGLTKSGNPIYIGQRLTVLDLYYTDFTALAEGGGDPYFQLGYKVGQANTAKATIYTLDLDIVSLAEIGIGTAAVVIEYTDDIDTGGGIFVNYTIKEETTIIKVDKGYLFGDADVEIAILSPFLALNAYNLVSVSYNGTQTEYFSNTTFNITLQLDSLGIGYIQITNYIVYDTMAAANGLVTLTLNDINGNPALVNGVQTQQIITSL